MRLIGFNFEKINAEKSNKKVENIKILSNMDISEIKEVKSNIFNSEESIVNVNFSYTLNYDPEFAKLEFKGNVLFSLSKDESEEVLTNWKDKKIPDNFKKFLLNIIIKKITLRSLQLEEELGLPTHIQIPSVKFDNKKE